uniref:procollagen-lysine 5-dioxygenase n=1 Tax=Setaria digitata TaxID=48799 RepID=A0A915PP06_9BILA
MYSFVILLPLLVPFSLTDRCDSSVYKLAVFALNNSNNDALKRLKCSAEHYNIDFKVLDVQQGSASYRNVIDKSLHMLAAELDTFKTLDSTILLIIDGEIQSVALIGFVPNILDVLDFIGSQDGKTLSYNNLYSGVSVDMLGLAYDIEELLFQNVDNGVSEVMLLFHDNGDAYIHNVPRNTYPSVILGSNKGSQMLNYLGNYVGKAWSAENGYRRCGTTSLLETSGNVWPSIALAVFITKPIPFIQEFLAAVSRLSYPTSRIDFYIYNNQKYSEKNVEEFLKSAKKLYRTVEYDNNYTELGEREARKAVLTRANEAMNDFVFMLDGDVHLITADTLELLIETATVGKFGIIAPLLTIHEKLFSNFWGALDINGYYARSDDYIEIIDGKRIGIWNVPYISRAILIYKDKIKEFENSYTYNVMVDADMSFCEFARTKMWENRYLHPKYFETLNNEDIPQPCPDVYEYPLMSENFTKELIEEMEHYGQWSSGKNEDDRLAGGYENVPTVDIHMNQINFEKEWLYFLDEYVRPMQEKLFIGYYQRPVEAIMMFVVRYKQGEQSSLRPHHDASTYTVDIPLNKRGKDYEGGGVHYVRYNCTVLADQIGYAAMFPGRLTHLHEGLPVTSGTRTLSAWKVVSKPVIYDVIVIGGGHAGCEAAAAAARCSARTLLLTHRKDTIGEMSCNPSFGGVGKGHLIREVDALDGLCGRICDKSAINYHALNASHGPAVLGLRAQIDRKLYKQHMQQEILNCTKGLDVMEGMVDDLIIESDVVPRVVGVIADGQILKAKAVVVTTGTFLGGKFYRGTKSYAAGRLGEKACSKLSETFTKLGFKLGRFRTGTPARLFKRTIDFSKFVPQQPDEKPIPFSFLTQHVWLPYYQQLPSYLGFTNSRLAEVVLKHVKKCNYIRSEVNGPRYCPSLESKVVRFPHLNHRVHLYTLILTFGLKTASRIMISICRGFVSLRTMSPLKTREVEIFLEHEGLDSELIYPQGMSMTFASEAQLEVYRCIPGMENVEISEAGYGIEYDYIDPKQLKPTLQTKTVKSLFLAGQINGTTGYEEAAAQGIVAGINAAASSQNNDKQQFVIDRTEGYIGVLIDDLTSLGASEPYRMFTSRAELRLHLRPDNADMRLTEKGYQHGAVSEYRYNHFLKILSAYSEAQDLLKSFKQPMSFWQKLVPRLKNVKSRKACSAFDLLCRYEIGCAEIRKVASTELKRLLESEEVEQRLKIEAFYHFYLDKSLAKIERIRKECGTIIPDDFDYSKMKCISAECKEKLEFWRPQNLAAASRVPGTTTEALMELLNFLKAP